MEHSRRNLCVGLALLMVLTAIALWLMPRSPLHQPARVTPLVSNSEVFVKNHVTGGIGVVMMMDQSTGHPRIQSLVPGSPAADAGLQAGDELLQVNDLVTAGQPLAKIVEACHGWTGGQITLTIQRADETNLVFHIRRASWSSLGVSTNPANGPGPYQPTNPAGTSQPAP